MRFRVLYVVIIVALVVLAAYFAVVAYSKAVDDFNQSPSATDWDFYATFDITCSVWWVTSVSANGVVDLIESKVVSFEDMSQGKVYEDMNLLRGHGGGGGSWMGFKWINVTVTGSGGFRADWESGQLSILDSHTQTSPGVVTWNTGRVFFENPGTYTVTVKIFAEMVDGYPYQISSKSQALEVSL